MKKICFFAIGIVISLVLLLQVLNSRVANLDLLGPVSFIKSEVNPLHKTLEFLSDFGGPATIELSNTTATSATIKLNGRVVFKPAYFNKNAPHLNVIHLNKPIPLRKGSNTLEVELNGQAGEQMSILITQAILNVEAVPQAISLRAPGSNSQVRVKGNLSDGTEVDLTGPCFGTAYSCEDPKVAAVTNEGLVTSVALGRTTLCVRICDFVANIPVEVRETEEPSRQARRSDTHSGRWSHQLAHILLPTF